MPNYSAQAIANEFLRRRGSCSIPQQMYIQKLAYIANGWNLAINGFALIEEDPQAWDNGPVFRSIWDHVRDFGYKGKNCTLADPATKEEIRADLAPEEIAVIEHVWRKYGPFSASLLSRMTHETGTPWYKAYFERGRNSKLDKEETRQHYVALAMAGRDGK
ncbi:putative phage-associated protein [Rhodoblastus acidophilus]|uniref:Panacea domain-containing protein n=1 Tax=Rhodoblastus acidophilus TaxID=1074 RepID=UPI00222539FB|nr:Panacea domain-containing protein [Rhodoblastus acidophilus]MCW2282491.1 putative phage-associated protein [Rhodoblastus acidophilus]MCW2331104.1 putative phage-associated protein [Rhodoblastus acidophilus]